MEIRYSKDREFETVRYELFTRVMIFKEALEVMLRALACKNHDFLRMFKYDLDNLAVETARTKEEFDQFYEEVAPKEFYATHDSNKICH